MFCPNCGNQIPVKDSLFCPCCGARLPKHKAEEPSQAAPSAQPVDAAPVRPKAAASSAKAPAPDRRNAPPAKAKPRKKKSRTGLWVACIAGALAVVGVVLFFLVIQPELQRVKRYNAGVDLLNDRDYTAAAAEFSELGGYADAAQMADYAYAMEAMSKENYKRAAALFTELGDFMDASTQLGKAKDELLYAQGVEAMQQGSYQEALDAFEKIPGVRDAETLAAQCRSQIAFAEAQALFASGSYGEALARLKDADGIPEADALRKQCENWIAYAEAKAKYDAGAYAEALDQLKGIEGVPAAAALLQDCRDRLTYADALKKYNDGAYAEAAELFSQVTHVDNAAKLLKECQQQIQYAKIQTALDKKDWAAALSLLNDSLAQAYPDRANLRQLCQNHITYDEAVNSLAEGRNYAAYAAFTSLGDYEDAAAKAKACIVSKPKSGETYRNRSYSRKDCEQLFVTPNDGQYTYIKIYAKRGSSEELVSCLFIHPNKTVKIYLPAGDYIIKMAYSNGDWFGAADMFGDQGRYQRLGGATGVLSREKGYRYTTKLRVGSGGNLGQANVDRDDF